MLQSYLHRPHLPDGYKYTLRLFLLVTSLDPLVAYLYEDGLIKFCTRQFTLDPTRLRDPYVHLTNESIQLGNTDAGVSYRTMGFADYRRLLRAEGVDSDALFLTTRRLVIETLIAIRDPTLRASRSECSQVDGCFELNALDVLVDEDLKPWLLECNFSPGWTVSLPTDSPGERFETQLRRDILADLVNCIDGNKGAVFAPIGDDPDVLRERFARERASERGSF